MAPRGRKRSESLNTMTDNFKAELEQHLSNNIRLERMKDIGKKYSDLNPRQRAYALMSTFLHKTKVEWAEFFNTTSTVICSYEYDDRIKQLKDEYRFDTFRYLQELTIYMGRRAFESLLNIMDTPSFHPDVLEVKRKTATDIISWITSGKLKSDNVVNFNFGQGSGNQNSIPVDPMTVKQFKSKYERLADLEELADRKVNAEVIEDE